MKKSKQYDITIHNSFYSGYLSKRKKNILKSVLMNTLDSYSYSIFHDKIFDITEREILDFLILQLHKEVACQIIIFPVIIKDRISSKEVHFRFRVVFLNGEFFCRCICEGNERFFFASREVTWIPVNNNEKI